MKITGVVFVILGIFIGFSSSATGAITGVIIGGVLFLAGANLFGFGFVYDLLNEKLVSIDNKIPKLEIKG
jgi:hypothetical protein